PKKNEEEQGWSWTGVNAIMSVHRKYDAPLTFFVLTKVLDVPRLRDLVLKTAPDKLVEISQHSHSHYLVRPLAPVKDQPVSLAEYIGDVSLAQDKLVDLIGQSPKGFRAPLGYYKGFKESEDVISGLTRFNFSYISSDARNSK